MTDTTTTPHAYTSTACLHGEHDACRKTCKYCDVSCSCTECDHTSVSGLPEPWVDQARGIARDLLAELSAERRDPELWRRIESDPAFFWLRGEIAPPGIWHQHHQEES